MNCKVCGGKCTFEAASLVTSRSFPEMTKEYQENLIQDNGFSGRDLNGKPLGYKSETSLFEPTCSVCQCCNIGGYAENAKDTAPLHPICIMPSMMRYI
jgi:hypothetical protein